MGFCYPIYYTNNCAYTRVETALTEEEYEDLKAICLHIDQELQWDVWLMSIIRNRKVSCELLSGRRVEILWLPIESID